MVEVIVVRGNPFKNPDLGTECPHCKAILEAYGNCYLSVGGSDYV